MDHTAIISLKNIVVEFDGEQVLRDISLDIHNHEFVTLLGPSGCGKTTTLRIIGGFVAPKSGDVFFDGEKINALPPYKREVNTIFQKYALFPHLDVFENIAFGLRLKKMPNEVVRQRVSEMLELVNLRGYEHKDVDLLSGG
ncbi:MAG TPA: ATP-binding cassette domain-containing protein, partial [Oscillospiraceae bacterium]|nr:ATP-binding cassette domain-containing protein [Oscillospiraceae bacterium]